MDVGLEKVIFFKTNPILDAGSLGVVVGFLDSLGVDVDADAAGAEILGGGDDDPAVAATEVVDEVLLGDLGHLEHLIDHFLRGRDVGDVGLDGLGGSEGDGEDSGRKMTGERTELWLWHLDLRP